MMDDGLCDICWSLSRFLG